MRGLSVSLGYNHTMREKILSDLNRLPLNRLDCTTFYRPSLFGSNRPMASVSTRATTFVAAGQSVRRSHWQCSSTQIGSRLQYRGSETLALAHPDSAGCSGRFIFTLMPSVWWTALRGKHADSSNRFGNIRPSILMRSVSRCASTVSKNMLATDIQMGRRNNLTRRWCSTRRADGGGSRQCRSAMHFVGSTNIILVAKPVFALPHHIHAAFGAANSPSVWVTSGAVMLADARVMNIPLR